MRKIKSIVLHTAAHGDVQKGIAYDTTRAQINAWHKERGWSGIGYHYVIRFDGTIERGRPITESGAHVAGFNSDTVGICMSGHGDIAGWTPKQLDALATLVIELMDEFFDDEDLPTSLSEMSKVLWGHREVNLRVKPGSQYRTTKTCPGKLINMDAIRALVWKRWAAAQETQTTGEETRAFRYNEAGARRLLAAMKEMYEAAKMLNFSTAALDRLNAYRKTAEVDEPIATLRRTFPEL